MADGGEIVAGKTGDVRRARRQAVMAAAEAAGLLAGAHCGVEARVTRALLTQALARSGAGSITELVEFALAKVALEDDFGVKLVARKGTIEAGVRLGV